MESKCPPRQESLELLPGFRGKVKERKKIRGAVYLARGFFWVQQVAPKRVRDTHITKDRKMEGHFESFLGIPKGEVVKCLEQYGVQVGNEVCVQDRE